jgi:hypothetical protein
MRPPPNSQEALSEALVTLEDFARGALTLEALMVWAERLESTSPEDAWLGRVAAALANPLLCREQALALVHEHLRAQRALNG